jgi:phosphoglycolate phosphatase-like HAD superfamily hydrolase
MTVDNPGRRRILLGGAMLAAAPAIATVASAQQRSSDALASWNEGAAKKSITDFVARVTTKGSPDFIAPAARIATFDNDGTLWSEQPMYFQLAFAFDRLKAISPQPPDMKAIMAGGEKALLEVVAKTHSGITTDEFNKIVADWVRTARHPRFKQPYTALVYQPMIELLRYLRANGFKTFIVSGGGVEFMRVFAERVYGIPPEQVIGSSGVTKFQPGPDGKPVLMKEPKVEIIDDGPGKPESINRVIGRRPVFAFGNSDGDLQMLQWTTAGAGARFAGIVHHTDAEREWAYDRKSQIGTLDKALDAANKDGWTVVNMKTDWKVIYPFEMKRSKS